MAKYIQKNIIRLFKSYSFNIISFRLLFCTSLTHLFLFYCHSSTSITTPNSTTDGSISILDSNLEEKAHIDNIERAFGMVLIPNTNIILISERKTSKIVIIQEDAIEKKVPITLSDRSIATGTTGRGDTLGISNIVLDPNYSVNRFIYIAITIYDENLRHIGITNHAILKSTFDPDTLSLNGDLSSTDIIFEQTGRTEGNNNSGGGALIFLNDETLLYSIGYNHIDFVSQDTNQYGGKVIRMTTNGEPVCNIAGVTDNPFCDLNIDIDPIDYIYTMGHKNIQSFTSIPYHNKEYILASEHGESGGDEINLISSGNNYGFPYFCSASCKPYDDAHSTFSDKYPMPEGTSINDFVRPLYVWTIFRRSMAPAGITFYHLNDEGPYRPYKNNILVATLVGKEVRRIHIDQNLNPRDEGPILSGVRMRDVKVSKDGDIYVLTHLHGLYRYSTKKIRFDLKN